MTGPAELPRGWAHTTVDEICDIKQGQAVPSNTYTSDPDATPFLQGNAEFGDSVPTPDKRTTSPRVLTDEHSVLLSVRAPVGAVNYSPGKIAIGRGLASLRPIEDLLDRRFLYWTLLSRTRWLEQRATGTTFSAVKSSVVRAVPIDLPPLCEQERILALLESELPTLERGRQDLLHAQRGRGLLRLAVLAELGKLDAPLTPIGELGDVFVGATPKRAVAHYWNGDIPWVSSGEVAFCRISQTRETITAAGLGNRETRLHPPGTVLLAMIGEGKTRGQAAVLDVAAAHNQNSASIRLDREKMLPDFLYLNLVRQYATSRAMGRGGQQPALNKELVKAIQVPCPPLDVQQDLINYVGAALRTADEYEADLALLERRASDERTALLRDALAGRLTVRELPTESVHEVLARVHAERKVTAPKRRSRRRASAAA